MAFLYPKDKELKDTTITRYLPLLLSHTPIDLAHPGNWNRVQDFPEQLDAHQWTLDQAIEKIIRASRDKKSSN